MSRLLFLMSVLILFLSTPGGAAEKKGQTRPLVVASTTQVYDFARQIAGDRCEVKSILAPKQDPHTYKPRPDDAMLVKRADLCLNNGLHLEGKNWMATLAKDAGKPLVTCTDGVKPLQLEVDGQKIHDPHAWFSPRNAAIYVNNITRALIDLDAKGEMEFRARAELYLQQLRVLDGWIKRQFNAVPKEKRILVTSHDAFNYFCEAYGFKNVTPVGWSTGQEVGGGSTPQRRRKVVESISSFGVKAIFVETSVNAEAIEEIAREAGVAVGGALYSDAMGEAGSAGETYIGMMRENVLTIVKALK